MRWITVLGVFIAWGGVGAAQDFTTAAEVRPILAMTRANWVSLREYRGADIINFTHILGWRCGLSSIRYGLNGAPATQVFKMEPCHTGSAQPNAITSDAVYVKQPLGSVKSISVVVGYDDGSAERAEFQRNQVLKR
ncbi:hypothetical protein [Phaeovulum sp.]|uniref:hypothetical protein n=1 Tax=Phaeovulum sp. TaxID=2934796 RepID=UPI0039E6F94B